MSIVIHQEQHEMVDGWIDIGNVHELFKDKNCYGTVVNGVKIGLFQVEDKIYALDDMCTHGNAKLSEGDVYGFEVECPLHAGAFDVRDGKALCAPLTRNTRSHDVCQMEDRVLVKVKPK